jgi:predicted amidohydrolase
MSEVELLRVGLTQWHATADVEANVEIAVDLICRAAAGGADIVVLPENGLMLGTNVQMRERALSQTGPEVHALASAAAEQGVTVVLGGMKNITAEGVFNSAVVIDAQGRVAGRYDKIHLFDATVNGQSFEASSVEKPGQQPVLLDLDGVKVGLTICYDVRFPELYRALALSGAELFLVPAAFTYVTGQAHWHALLRARAIENGCYVVASATVRSPRGPGQDAFETYGHALVVSPWGEVLAVLGEETPVIQIVDLDLSTVRSARRSLPVLAGTRPLVYRTEPRTITTRSTQEAR